MFSMKNKILQEKMKNLRRWEQGINQEKKMQAKPKQRQN